MSGECNEEGDKKRTAKDAQDAPCASRRARTVPVPAESGSAAAATKESAERSMPSTASTTMKPTMHSECDLPAQPEVRLKNRVDGSHRADSSSERPAEPPLDLSTGADSSAPSNESNEEEQVLIPPCIGEDEVDALLHAMTHPPVTKESLEELDLKWIQTNINLRIDINYDHDLEFTPVEGEKGTRKKEEARRYYSSLEAELKIAHHYSSGDSCPQCEKSHPSRLEKSLFTPRLPLLFRNLKELLVMLVPDEDQYQIAQNLDISLRLQEMSKGLLDVVRLAHWLSALLTNHCAPIRDDSAREMADQIRNGAEKGDLHKLVVGIEKLFEFLEAMKLDIANHQIRTFRYVLIDDTIAFQHDFFQKRIESGTIEVKASRDWYWDADTQHQECNITGQTPRLLPVSSLIHGLREICLSCDSELPVSIAYDAKRIRDIRVDVQDTIHLDMCLSIFNRLLREFTRRCGTCSVQGIGEARIAEMQLLLQYRIMDLTDGTLDLSLSISQIWLGYAEEIALELGKAVANLCPHSGDIVPGEVIEGTAARLRVDFEQESDTHRRAKELGHVLEQKANDNAASFLNMTPLGISRTQKQWQQLKLKKQGQRALPDSEDMARRLAHIAVIHYRVWADLIYLEFEDGREQGDQGDQGAQVSG